MMESTINEKRLVDRFFQLERIDSETGNERQICDLLTTIFRELGCEVLEDDTMHLTGHGAGNLIAFLPASSGMEDAAGLMFTCHMDTVKPGQGIRPRLDEDGYIRSDGTTILGSDDKAGICAILEGLQIIKECTLPHGPLQFIITVGEEAGLIGAKALNPEMIHATYGFAFDSNGQVGEIVTAGPAQAKIHAIVHGRSAHAGVNPEQGISAIQVASRAISKMKLGRIDHETTANIGKFVGGGETNIVCDRVELFAEARSHNAQKLAAQIDRMESALQEVATEYGASVTFSAETVYPAFTFTDTDSVVRIAKRAMERIHRTPLTVKSGGGSDANIFNGFGLPTLNLAIGYEHIHTTSEQMPLSELIKAAELVLALIQEVIADETQS